MFLYKVKFAARVMLFFSFVHIDLCTFDLILVASLLYMIDGGANAVNLASRRSKRGLVRCDQLAGLDLLAVFSTDDGGLKVRRH